MDPPSRQRYNEAAWLLRNHANDDAVEWPGFLQVAVRFDFTSLHFTFPFSSVSRQDFSFRGRMSNVREHQRISELWGPSHNASHRLVVVLVMLCSMDNACDA
jgi:hypothetical protein